MCDKCDKYNGIDIRGPEEMYKVTDHLKEAVLDGILIEIKETGNEASPKQTYLNEIIRDKPWPNDIIEIYLQCTECKNKLKLFCDTYHGSGGHIKYLKTN